MSINRLEHSKSGRSLILTALSVCLTVASCDPPARDADSNVAPPVETPIETADTTLAEALPSPDVVLDRTDVFEIASYPIRPLDESAAGTYGIEQGGAGLTLTLSVTGEEWLFERTHQEPGQPADRVARTVHLSDGLMMSTSRDVIIRGTDAGVLVLERKSNTIPADYWVLYLRHNQAIHP